MQSTPGRLGSRMEKRNFNKQIRHRPTKFVIDEELCKDIRYNKFQQSREMLHQAVNSFNQSIAMNLRSELTIGPPPIKTPHYWKNGRLKDSPINFTTIQLFLMEHIRPTSQEQ